MPAESVNMSVNIAGVTFKIRLRLLPEHLVQAWNTVNMLTLTDLVL